MSAALPGVVTVARGHRGRRAGLQQGAHSASSAARATILRAPGPVSAGPVDQRGPQGGGAGAARSIGPKAAARQASQAGSCSAGITHPGSTNLQPPTAGRWGRRTGLQTLLQAAIVSA